MEIDLEKIAQDFANAHTPKNAYSISKADLKFGFKEGVRYILTMIKREENKEPIVCCEHQED